MSVDTKLCLHNITLKVTLNCGKETWFLNQKETHELEALQVCV